MKKEIKTTIDEAIADAIAEEEVTREQEKAIKEEKASADFRDLLREQLKDALTLRNDDAKVTISLKDYIILKQKEVDLDRILNSMVDSVYLNYSKDELRLNGDRVIETMRVLYPEVYDTLLATEIAEAQSEE